MYTISCPPSCGAVKPQWHEWFSRGLKKGTHYLEVPAAPLPAICPALLKGMLAMEKAGFSDPQGANHSSTAAPRSRKAKGRKSAKGRKAKGRKKVHAAVALDRGTLRNGTAALQKNSSDTEVLQPPASVKGSTAQPGAAAMAQAQTQFVQNQLRMQASIADLSRVKTPFAPRFNNTVVT